MKFRVEIICYCCVTFGFAFISYSQDLSERLYEIEKMELQISQYLDSLQTGTTDEVSYVNVLNDRLELSMKYETQRILTLGKKCGVLTEKKIRLSGEIVSTEYASFSGGDDAFYEYLMGAEGNLKIVHKNNKFANYAFSVNFIIDDFGLPRIVSFENETDNTCDECKVYLKTLFANAPKWTPKKINGVSIYSETKTLRIYFLR